MKKRLCGLGLTLLLLLPIAAYAYTYHYTNSAVAVTAVSQSVPATGSFINNHSGGDNKEFWATEVVIRNFGANEAFVDCDDGIATTADTIVQSGETLTCAYTGHEYARIGIIASAGETTTVAVDAIQ